MSERELIGMQDPRYAESMIDAAAKFEQKIIDSWREDGLWPPKRPFVDVSTCA